MKALFRLFVEETRIEELQDQIRVAWEREKDLEEQMVKTSADDLTEDCILILAEEKQTINHLQMN